MPASSTTNQSTKPTALPLHVADVSQFCKQLRAALIERETELPSHLTLLNLIVKSAGYRNMQAFRAATLSAAGPIAARPIEPPAGHTLTKPALRALSHFGTDGRLTRFPTQLGVRLIALWGIWCRLAASRTLTEPQVNDTIARYHGFNDVATLRRELVNAKMLWRTTDGREYRRLAVKPSEEEAAFLKVLHRATR